MLDVWVGNLTTYQRGGVENIDLNSYASQNVMPQSDCGTGYKLIQSNLISHHLKCKDLVATYGSWWSLTRIEPQGVSSKRMYGHNYFMEDNLLHAISKL